MSNACGHLLCELIDESCSLATGRSRGCSPGIASSVIAPELIEEVRGLLAVLAPDAPDAPEKGDARVRAAAVRLAEIIRREARQDRHVLAHVRTDEPELVDALERLVIRRR